MWPVPSGFLDALATSHGMAVTIKTYLAGVELGTVAFESGSVSVTATNRVRRRIDDLIVPESLWPVGDGDLLSPYGVELRVWWTLVTGITRWPAVPVFTGRVETVSRVRRSGTVRVTCSGRMAQINDEAFEAPRQAPAGARVTDTIRVLIQEVYPDAVVTNFTGSAATIPAGLVVAGLAGSAVTIPAGLTWDAGDGSRGRAIDELALATAAEVVELPDGNFVIRPVPTIDDPSVWTVATGADGVVVGDAQAKSRLGVANRWLVQVERPDSSTPITVPVQLDSGPLRYGGPYGRVTRAYRNPTIASEAAATAVGQAILSRIKGMTRARTVEVIANPALDVGDVLTVITDDGTERHIGDAFRLPLSTDSTTMRVDTRSVSFNDLV